MDQEEKNKIVDAVLDKVWKVKGLEDITLIEASQVALITIEEVEKHGKKNKGN